MINRELEKKCYTFLLNAYFPNSKESVYQRVGLRAYRDFCRTFHTNEDTKKLRNNVYIELETAVSKLLRDKVVTQETYDLWHWKLSDKLFSMCNALTYGHVQKWINMTMKYLLVLEPETFQYLIPYMHVPIDQHVIICAKQQFGLKTNFRVWSQIESYEIYEKYQTSLRKQIQRRGTLPIQWEFINWK